MDLIPRYTEHPRRYARRLPPDYARRSALTVRLTPEMKDALAFLAAYRKLSMCEYTARIINDHLTSVWKSMP
jgi:predicted HicB family RNase H-like nuclease